MTAAVNAVNGSEYRQAYDAFHYALALAMWSFIQACIA